MIDEATAEYNLVSCVSVMERLGWEPPPDEAGRVGVLVDHALSGIERATNPEPPPRRKRWTLDRLDDWLRKVGF